MRQQRRASFATERGPMAFLLLILVAGCAQFPGIGKVGDERYIISTSATSAQGGLTAAERAAYDQAGARCTSLGKTVSLVDERKSPPVWSDGAARVDLTFVCR